MSMVESQREIPGPSTGANTIERETCFHITSLIWIAAPKSRRLGRLSSQVKLQREFFHPICPF
jgi:hypothetical protein